MKKTAPIYALLILIFFSCKKKDEIVQLTFNFKNESTLLDKSLSYIKAASPGEFLSQYSTSTKVFFYYDGATSIGGAELFYSIKSDKCDMIQIYALNQTVSGSFNLIMLANNELGAALDYQLIYTDTYSIKYTKVFNTLNELQNFITINAISDTKINSLTGYYQTNEYIFLVGGMTQNSVYYPLAQINSASKSKKTQSTPMTKSMVTENFKFILKEDISK